MSKVQQILRLAKRLGMKKPSVQKAGPVTQITFRNKAISYPSFKRLINTDARFNDWVSREVASSSLYRDRLSDPTFRKNLVKVWKDKIEKTW